MAASRKRVDLSSLVDVTAPPAPRAAGRPDGQLERIPLTRISPNRVNPRTDFGTPEALVDLGRSLGRRQLQPVLCVRKRAYLEIFPEHAEELEREGRVDVVLVNGERRYRAALAANLTHLDAMIDDAVAESRKTFRDAVYTENKDRENFNPIEEARAIEDLVTEFGSTNAVAEHYNRSKTWVVQRRNLLKLTPDLQTLTISGEIPVRVARELATLDPDQQLPTWEAQKARPKPERKPRNPKEPAVALATDPGKTAAGERILALGRELDLDVDLMKIKASAVTMPAETVIRLLERLASAERSATAAAS
jgi:ParB family transcriptional regulator, chromosome partitioning protein